MLDGGIRHRARHRCRWNDLRREPRPARGDPMDARDDRRRTAPTGTSPASRRSTCRSSAPVVARSRGSTTAACSTSARRARAQTPGRPATGGAATEPTVTDACVVLGYIDPDYFLGGEMTTRSQRARGGGRAGHRRAARARPRRGSRRGPRPRHRADGQARSRGSHSTRASTPPQR